RQTAPSCAAAPPPSPPRPPPRSSVPRVPRRNLIPLVMLAVLAVLTAVFALLGLSNAPPTGSLVVQNATARSFGSPAGRIRFAVELTTTVATGAGTGGTASHVIDYKPPDRMIIYQVT